MFEAKNARRSAPLEDGRMWRLLLARLHPDAGGDPDLFAFACAVRDELSAATPGEEPVDPFLKTWQDAMDHWSSTNRDALRSFWPG